MPLKGNSVTQNRRLNGAFPFSLQLGPNDGDRKWSSIPLSKERPTSGSPVTCQSLLMCRQPRHQTTDCPSQAIWTGDRWRERGIASLEWERKGSQNWVGVPTQAKRLWLAAKDYGLLWMTYLPEGGSSKRRVHNKRLKGWPDLPTKQCNVRGQLRSIMDACAPPPHHHSQLVWASSIVSAQKQMGPGEQR